MEFGFSAFSATSAVNALQSSLEQRNCDSERDRGKERKKKHVSPNRRQSRLLQQQALETINRISERIDSRNRLQPWWECLNGINRPAGEEQQRIENAEHGARHQRIFDAHHK